MSFIQLVPRARPGWRSLLCGLRTGLVVFLSVLLFGHLGMRGAIATPLRVVTLGNAALEAALSVDIVPVGAAPWVAAGYQGAWPPFVTPEQRQAMRYLGDVNQPDLEQIVALHPDVILGSRNEHQMLLPLLAQIAPTVLCDVLGQPWQACFWHYAEALGQRSAAQTVLAHYNARLMALRAKATDETVAVLRFMPNQVRLYLPGSHIGQILQTAGFVRPPLQQQRDRWQESLSLESLPRADADILFVTQSDPRGRLFAQFRQSPFWQELRAVQRGQVYVVDFATWIGGEGAIAANQVLTDLWHFRGRNASRYNG